LFFVSHAKEVSIRHSSYYRSLHSFSQFSLKFIPHNRKL
jgi:hypothetical protein